ncbi:MAG: glycosyltransferase family 4 protein [Alphaproteobacteria bacterium]|nr:glycosyltransferase family 4 protein [Alphaproteobacteria bacterium]
MKLPSSVLVLTNHLTTGGAEAYVVAVSGWLAAQGVRVAVAASPGPLVDRLAPGVAYHPTPLTDVRAGLPVAALRVARLVRRHRPDVILANSLVTAWVGRLASAGRVPVVSVAHGWAADRYRLVARPLAVADTVVAVSEDVARRLKAAGLPDHKVTVVPNGIDLAPFHPRSLDARTRARALVGAGEDEVVVLNVGRFTDQKQQRHLIEVARRLRDTLPELRFGIVGLGPLEDDLRARIAAAGVADTVRLLVARRDVPDLLMAADLYLSTSDWEGMPLSMIEAMAAGLPIVSTHVEGIGALVDDDNGALCPPGDVDALTEAVARFGRDEVLRLHKGSQSRARAERDYSLPVMCGRLAEVLAGASAR